MGYQPTYVSGGTRQRIPGSYQSALTGGITTSALVDNTCYFVPVSTSGGAIDRAAVSINVLSTGVIRLGVYAPTTTGVPGAVLYDFGTVPATATGLGSFTLSNTYLPAGTSGGGGVRPGGHTKFGR